MIRKISFNFISSPFFLIFMNFINLFNSYLITLDDDFIILINIKNLRFVFNLIFFVDILLKFAALKSKSKLIFKLYYYNLYFSI